MIITCEKCSTRFNLDDSLVKASGSNVRCSVCKNIFTAYPASRQEEPEIDLTSGLTLENDTDDRLADVPGMDEDLSLDAPDPFEMDDNDFSLNEPDLEMGTSELELDSPELEMDDNFSFEESELEIQTEDNDDSLTEPGELAFESAEIEFDDTDDDDLDGLEFEPYQEDDDSDSLDSISIEEDKNDLTFEDDDSSLSGLDFEEESTLTITDDQDQDLELEMDDSDNFEEPVVPMEDSTAENDDEEEFELEFDVEEEADSPALEMETRPEEAQSSLTLENDALKDVEQPTITPEDDLDGYDEPMDQKHDSKTDTQTPTMGMDDSREEESLLQMKEPDQPSDPGPRKKRKKKALISTPVLFLLLLFLLVVGAYIASIMTGYKIPYLSDIKIPVIEKYLGKGHQAKTSSSQTQTEKKDWNGRFVDNETAGRLFIITGRIENISGAPLSYVKVKGILQTRANQIITSKEVYCGNILSEETLRNASMETIDQQLQVRDGRHKLNVNIKPGGMVDYMIVFNNLSDDLDNFLVKVVP